MKNCKYYLSVDGHNIILNSDEELSSYIENNLQTTEGQVYVKSSLHKSKEQVSVEEALKQTSPYQDTAPNPYKFLASKHIINGKEQLLVPIFNDTNYRKVIEDEIKLELTNPTPEVLKNAIDKKITTDRFMQDLSINFSQIFRHRLNSRLTSIPYDNTLLIKAISKIINFNDSLLGSTTTITKDMLEVYSEKILSRIDSQIKTLIDKGGVLHIHPSISVNDKLINDQVDMSAFLDILNINEDGTTDLYDIRVSEQSYDSWHKVKKRTADYLLGIKRQLLANYIDVSHSTLNIINIQIPQSSNGTLNLDNIFIFGDIELTRGKELSGEEYKSNPLNFTNGAITTRLRELLPARVLGTEEVSTELVDRVKSFLGKAFPKYQLKTKNNLDVEDLIKRQLENSKNQKEIFFYDKLKTHDNKVVISKSNPNWENEFREKITEYVQRWNEAKDSRMLALVDEINSVKKSFSKEWSEKFRGQNGVIEKIISKYLSSEWTFLNPQIKQLNELGILLFQDNSTNTIEAIAITSNDLNNIHHLGLGSSLLGFYKRDDQVHNNQILKASGAHIEAIKVLTTLNELKQIFSGNTLSGIEILNMNPFDDKAQLIILDRIIDNYNQLFKEVKTRHNLTSLNNFENKNIKRADVFTILYHKITSDPFLTTTGSRARKVAGILTNEDFGLNLPSQANDKLQWFIRIQQALLDAGLGLEKDMKGLIDIEDPLQNLYNLVSEGIVYYKGLISNTFDYNSPEYGIRIADATHFISSAIFGNAPEYDKNGNQIVGLMQGSQFTSTDALKSKTIGNLHNLITIAHDKISEHFQKEHAVVLKATETYYDNIGRSSLQRWTIGSADDYHRVFFETDLHGNVTSEFRFKNPWNPNSNLDNVQRNYLKNILFAIYKNSNLNKTNISTLQEFEKSASFEEVEIGISPLFYAPLMKSTKSSRWIPSFKEFHKSVGRAWDSVKDELDPSARTEEERVRSFKNINDFNKVHNQYDLGIDQSFRESLLEKYGVEHFEINLDTIATKYILEHLREKYLNSILLDIHAAITMIKVHGINTGNTQELIDALNTFWDQIKISVYNTSIIEGEGAEAIMLIKKAQRVASLMTIALRPMLMAKELTVGLIKNVSFAFYKTYGEESFAEDDLLFGYTQVLNPDQENFMLNGALNQVYRIANMDLNQLPKRVKYDRFGLNFLSDNFYWFSTAPDYVNRLSIFFAKMKKDGSFNAHSLNEQGELIYDPTKDKRYSHYLANRNLYKVDGKYQFTNNDSLYTHQRSMYLAALDIFNEERVTLGLPLLTEEDMLPKAYTSKEKGAIKTFIDTAYGHYDHETTPLIFHGTAGILFGQFLRYFPDKVRFYFGTENVNAKSGYMGQKIQILDDGTRVPLWQKRTDLEDGNFIIEEVPESELSSKDVKVAATGWVGEPSEGIMYSLAHTIYDLRKGNLAQTSPLRIRQSKLAINDLLMSLLLLWLGSLMMGDKKDWKEKTEVEKTLTKLGMKTGSDLNFITSIFATLNATPSFINILGNVSADIKEFLSGNMGIASLLKQNIRMLEILPIDLQKK